MTTRWPALIVAFILGSTCLPAGAGAGGRVMLVVDSSLAMQGALGNETKMEAAKNALGLMFQRFDGSLDMGVASYGSRKAKACADVQVLSPPVPLRAARLARHVAPLRPTGSAALGQAIAEAATALGPAGKSDRMLVIVGGPDACGVDPCAVAKQARADHKIRIDVVAIRSPGQDLKPLRCIAKLSGGTYFEVGNTAKLVGALETVLAKVAVSGADIPALAEGGVAAGAPENAGEDSGGLLEAPYSAPLALAEPEADAQDAPLADDDLDSAMTADGKVPTLLSALLADPGPRIDSGLTWRVYERKSGSDGLHALVARSDDAAPRLALPPGDYIVNVAYGRAYLTRSIKVAAGSATREVFVLNAGGLRLTAQTANGQSITAAAVANDIFADERDQAGERALVVSGVKPGTILRLNAGIYHIKSNYGDANGIVQGDVSIEAGRLTDLTIIHQAATVTLKLVAQSGGEALADTQWRIYTPDGALVLESVGALPTHILAPGSYNVEAVRGGQKYAEAFEVVAGQPRTVEVVLPE